MAFLELMSYDLPDGYASQEVNYLTLAYFAVAGLSLLRELDRVSPAKICPAALPLGTYSVHARTNRA